MRCNSSTQTENSLSPVTPEASVHWGHQHLSGYTVPLIGSCHVRDSVLAGMQLIIHFNWAQQVFRALPGETSHFLATPTYRTVGEGKIIIKSSKEVIPTGHISPSH